MTPPKPAIAPKLLTIPEAAEALRVSKWHVERLLRRGLLHPIRLSSKRATRIAVAELDRYIAACADESE